MPTHGPTSWCPHALSPRARGQKKLTALSASATLTARSGQASTTSSRAATGRLSRSTTGHPTKGPIWCLATGNGYDVSNLRWMGGKTYAEIVHALLASRRRPASGSSVISSVRATPVSTSSTLIVASAIPSASATPTSTR